MLFKGHDPNGFLRKVGVLPIILLALLSHHQGWAQITPEDRAGTEVRSSKEIREEGRSIVRLEWKVFEKRIRKDEVVRFLGFDQANFDGNGLPLFTYRKKVGKRGQPIEDVSFRLTNKEFAPLSDKEKKVLGEEIKDIREELSIETHVGYDRGEPKGVAQFAPLIRDPATGRVKKLVSFDIELKGVTNSGKRGGRSHHSFASSSVLSSGDWFKIGVTRTGMHALSYSFLSNLGVPVDSIDSRDLNVFGNGFGMLPYENDGYLPDDLKKNAVKMEDGGDGSFDPGDRILFYAKGPHIWEFDTTTWEPELKFHNYSDTSYYFVGVKAGPPKRVQALSTPAGAANETVTSFVDHVFHEKERVNLIHSGRQWAGENLSSGDPLQLDFFQPNLIPGKKVRAKVRVLSRTLGKSNSSYFEVGLEGASLNLTVNGVKDHYLAKQGRFKKGWIEWTPSSTQDELDLNVQFFGSSANSKGWLDHIRLYSTRSLQMDGQQLMFRDTASIGPGNIAKFRFKNSSQTQMIWDVTDPTNARSIPFSMVNNSPTFKVRTDSLREFIAFSGAGAYEPISFGAVSNQDLHALPQVDMIILAHPALMGPSEQLASFHRAEGLKVEVVTPKQVYNEFSSGIKDISAIKWFMKMFYERAGTDTSLMPDYLLLMGDGSFQNRNGSAQNVASRIPTYQSVNSMGPTQSYVSDDYYGLLDDSEGENLFDVVDIGIGRLPAQTKEQAQAIVNKIRSYDQVSSSSSAGDICSNDAGTSQNSNWRNLITFMGDDEDSNVHMGQANQLANKVHGSHPEFDIAKIFLDAYRQVTSTGGERYPDAEKDLEAKLSQGTLIFNYTGHGGEKGFTKERVVRVKMIRELENMDNLPLWITATCEFSRFDDPSLVSAGEEVILNENGGGIGLLSTTRVVYSSPNFTLNSNFYDHVFDEPNGKPQRLGDLMRKTKSASVSNSTNHRNFTLLADPALRLALPEEEVHVDKINNAPVSNADTMKALSKVTVEGSVKDASGNLLNGFNGVVYPVVFDKKKDIETLANDGGTPFNFSAFKNRIHKGKSSVTNGKFEFSFIVPKDIAYQFGKGRMSFYAEGGGKNAHGYNQDFTVGGTAENPGSDNQGPEVDLYLNDRKFVSGGVTDRSPLLVADLEDENGINTIGSGIGHDLTAILDGDNSQALVLNEHYESDLDTYRSGTVKYRFSDLEEGEHTLKLKAWDVYNNSSSTEVDFVVASSEEMALEHVLNYPNPFTTHTEFFFEHNQVCQSLHVRIRIFTVSGKLVKTIDRNIQSHGFRSEGIDWNGKDRFGDPLARGVYVYELKVSTPEGKSKEKIEKLVILN